ncbi:MAG: hypothetical protein Q8S73_36745 [Deltaproteobacteria bacterium]|nr:hypothetical protein [Myxococcales bacterium]MDP3219708.1 hypothetical protein [Deltaproteobacteria bacterium]
MGYIALERISADQPMDVRSQHGVWIYAIRMLAEALVSIALIFFGYQLLRVAERMLAPPSLLTRDNIEVLRALIGIETPADGASRIIKSATDLANSISRKKPDA